MDQINQMHDSDQTPALIPGARHDLQPSTALVQEALNHAAEHLTGDTSGHDIHHVFRVFRTAQRLATATGADPETTELIAALHDVDDFKFSGDELAGSRAARTWLTAHGIDPASSEGIATDVAGISFKGARTATSPLTLEGRCVQDADRLDALGAIGAARCFAYGGRVGRPIHDPAVAIVQHESAEQYMRHQGTSITHFYEKLLLLKDRLHTEPARQIAAQRHRFLEEFLQRFYAEWNARD